MKNKNKQQMQLELIELLLGSVNSKQEFDFLLEERKKFFPLFSYRDVRRYA